MTWSSSGSAATYPTFTPGYAAGYAGNLVFRLDPNSRIVYVTGYWAATTVPSPTVTNIFAAALPANIRPQAQVVLYQLSGSYPLTLNPGGTAPTGNAQNGGQNAVRAFYFTDTIPA